MTAYKLALKWVFFSVAMFSVVSFTFTNSPEKPSAAGYVQRDCAAVNPSGMTESASANKTCQSEAKTERGRSNGVLASSDAVEFLKKLIFFRITWNF